ncbi:MAG: tetratricopeptide repeat protein [Chloroflexi bacterium]|nr:tetratricopeptide repeat protein [Chloroflexota bacterium]
MWQEFIQQHAEQQPFTFLSVAVDVDPERPRPFAEPHTATFQTVVDSASALGRLFDFDVVPNGVFLDEHGIIRFLHIGGFDVRRPDVAQQVEALLTADFTAGDAPQLVQQEAPEVEVLRVEVAARPDNASLHFALGDALLREGRPLDAQASFTAAVELNRSDWSAAFGLGTALYQQGRAAEAVTWWKAARELDPQNFTVRKQIWMVEHPERFYPTIDTAWQKEQLIVEGYVRPS